jgi:two-component system CheB/CheR fusion protein
MAREKDEEHFEELLEFLKRNRGFDFTGYKRSSLVRRVRKRMQEVGVPEFAAYLEYLEVHPNEFAQLFNTILINVTSFFRDPETWSALERVAVPRLIDAGALRGGIRVWSAGCASGQETYTLVMVLAEALGLERFRDRVKIYATDADEDALTQARLASYTARDLEGVSPHLLEKYFDLVGKEFVFRNDLRRSIIFGRHDLVQDAPISRLDLLVCRNTLIYFNSETQSRILARFHFALHDEGQLFLGKSEMLLSHGKLFAPLDARTRLFVKVPKPNLRERLLILAQAGHSDASTLLEQQAQIRDVAFDVAPVAQIVVDRSGTVVFTNEQARALFRLTPRDTGRSFHELELSYRPVELRSRMDEAASQQHIVELPSVEFQLPHGEVRNLDISVRPLLENGTAVMGFSISFADVTQFHTLRVELERSSNELESAYEELQATNEELETTNEELQSTVEELETTNEELQATNEELETMNEELQSTNEELETINDELRGRTDELNRLNVYTEAVLASLRAAVVVLDRDMQVRTWSSKAADLWGVRPDEVERKPFLDLDIGLPVSQLQPLIHRCMGGQDYEEVVLDSVNRRGRGMQCRVMCVRMKYPQDETAGVILMIEEWPHVDGKRALEKQVSEPQNARSQDGNAGIR